MFIHMKKLILTYIATALIVFTAVAQNADQVFKAAGTPVNPKVPISWNRYYDYAGVTEICKKLAAAHPNLIKLQSLGKSFLGKEIWLLTVTDFTKGKHNEKPAMYIDGNIHSNEIQGTEFSLYTAWYLAETFADTEFIRELLADKTFYIAPTINPDARDFYMKEPNNPNTPRSGMIPFDNDRDNVVDEDGINDLDGNGHITFMRRKNPNGRWIEDPEFPERMIPAPAGVNGQYDMLGFEGLDADGDGFVNEDGVGFYDPNRDWGWNWQPDHIQGGAHKYPFSIPENRAVADFVLAHPNIAGAQSYHNSGGMILRGPGAEEDLGTYNAQDVQIYDAIGRKGEELIPGYRYLVVYKDLYSVFGGELDWFYGSRGIYTFTNELFTSYLYYNRNLTGQEGQREAYRFNKDLIFGDAFVPWKEFNHPQFGLIEIGGFKKNFGRATPGFLLESEGHRNMAFTIFHAYHTPKLEVFEIKEKDLGGGIKEVTVIIANTRLMPTHSSQDLKYKIERPNLISIEGANVVAGMLVQNADLGLITEQKTEPNVLRVDNIPGMGTVTVRWIVSGNSNYTIKVDSRKGGVVSRRK